MSDTNIADSIFKERGGIYQTKEKDHLEFINFCNDHIRLIRSIYRKLPEIEVVLINNESLNATAAKSKDGLYFIGFNIGLIDAIKDIFLKMVAIKKSNSDEDIHVNLSRGKFGVQYDPDAPKSDIPVHYLDEKIMMYHVILVYKFIIYHEVCHILRGHVDFIDKKFNAILSENDQEEDSDKVDFLQTLEMDADSFAINRLIGELFEGRVSKSHPGFGELYSSLIGYTYHLMYGLYTFFRLFGFYQSDTKHYQLSHPVPSVRMTMILSNIGTIFYHYNPKDKDAAIEEALKAIIFADESFCLVSYMESDVKKFYNIFMDSNTKKHMDKIRDNWKVLFAELSKYTYAPLPENNL